MRNSIGIDVSKEKLDLCWLRDRQTRKKKSKVFKNQRISFAELVAWILRNTKAEPQDIRITLEATGVYHEALVYFLHEQGFTIFMANPGKAKKYAESIGLTHKTDKSDAAMLSYYGEAQPQDIKLWQPEAPEVRELKSLMRRLSALEKDHQREENRLESCEISDTSDRVRQSLHEMIAALEAEIEKLTQNIDDHIDHHPQLKKNRQLLESIKGIGKVMSRELTYLFAAKQFKTAKQVAAYMGLIPKLRESGKFKGYTALSKTGPSRLRAKLYMAAVTAKQHNPDIRKQYERLLAAGKTKMSALGAAMRKLVQVCFGVVKNQSEFQAQTV